MASSPESASARAHRLRVLGGFWPSATVMGSAGPLSIVALTVAWAIAWTVLRPSGQILANDVGQLCGAESILLLSIGLVLISTLPWVEGWFDGIDRAAIWHRRVAIAGVLLLIPHIVLSKRGPHGGSGQILGIAAAVGLVMLVIWAIVPRWRSVLPGFTHRAIVAAGRIPGLRDVRARLGGYERWRSFHRLTGVFVAVGFIHGLMDATSFGQSATLRLTYVVIAGIGLTFYAYRELLARHFVSLHDYQIDRVTSLGDGMTEISLVPLGVPLSFVPGQFVMLFLESASGWRRHPFSITSQPGSGPLRFTVKALGDHTASIGTELEPGMPAVIRGPFGRFSYLKGHDRQVWIAGGVGIAPFLSWVRSLGDAPIPRRIDFFYSSSDGGAPFAAELDAIAERHSELHLHLVNTTVDGRITVESVLAATGDDPANLSAFLCGPEGMVRSLQAGLRRAGVPRRAIHREHFVWR